MDDILRFFGATKRDATIDAWLEKKPAELGSIAQKWFSVMRECGGDVVELMHDGAPTACIGDAAFGYVNVFRSHVNVGFFKGAYLPDPAGLLEGTGKHMRHVRLRPELEYDALALRALIAAAYSDMKNRIDKL
jgi:hypothetical protein